MGVHISPQVCPPVAKAPRRSQLNPNTVLQYVDTVLPSNFISPGTTLDFWDGGIGVAVRQHIFPRSTGSVRRGRSYRRISFRWRGSPGDCVKVSPEFHNAPCFLQVHHIIHGFREISSVKRRNQSAHFSKIFSACWFPARRYMSKRPIIFLWHTLLRCPKAFSIPQGV